MAFDPTYRKFRPVRGYGRHESGLRRESAAVAGAFGGRRDPPPARLDMRGRGPKGYTRSDARLLEDVCEAFTDDPVFDAGDIEVSVAQGDVTLAGSVGTRRARHHAEDIAAAVRGVRHVQNDLRVMGSGDKQRQPGEATDLGRFGELS